MELLRSELLRWGRGWLRPTCTRRRRGPRCQSERQLDESGALGRASPRRGYEPEQPPLQERYAEGGVADCPGPRRTTVSPPVDTLLFPPVNRCEVVTMEES